MELHTIEGQIDTSSPDGFMNYAMRAFLGEMERRQIKDRTEKAMQHKKQNGEVVGGIPYGWKREGDKLVEDPAEQKVRKYANRLYHRNGKALTDIAKALNNKGHRTRSGRKWSYSRLRIC